MDSLVSMRVFCLVAELKSFATAAQRLRISPAMASKHVMQLEKRLGTRLLNRTSRRVSLSESGALYFEQARQMLDSLDEVEAAVSNATVVPHGTLRLTAPVWMANRIFAGVLADYQARYPEVRLDVDLSGRLVNLVEEGFDLALRATAAPDEALIARPITNVPFYLVAAPAFLKRTGARRRSPISRARPCCTMRFIPARASLSPARTAPKPSSSIRCCAAATKRCCTWLRWKAWGSPSCRNGWSPRTSPADVSNI